MYTHTRESFEQAADLGLVEMVQLNAEDYEINQDEDQVEDEDEVDAEVFSEEWWKEQKGTMETFRKSALKPETVRRC